MKNAQYTRQERFILVWLRFLTLLFLVVGGLLAFLPKTLFDYLDNIGRVFLQYQSWRNDFTAYDLWWVLTWGYLAVLVVLTFQAQRDWLRYHLFVPIVLFAKFLNFAGLGALAVFQPYHFFYLVGAVADGLLFLITAYAYAKAIKSRTFISHTS